MHFMYMNTYLKINDENKTRVIGLLTIFISCWMVFYFIPEMFVSLFHTLLGNLILILSILLMYMYNRAYAFFFGLICFLLLRFSQLSREGFTQQSITNFLNIQSTINKQSVFDMNEIATQASQEELDYFNEHGIWPWSDEVIQIYEDAVNQNPYVKTLPQLATYNARTKYNEQAILQAMDYQSKAGALLNQDNNIYSYPKDKMPSGFGTFGYTSGLIQE